MPNILMKRPGSSYKIEFCSSKVFPDLENEIGYRLFTISIGRGLFLLVQTNNSFIDTINVTYDDNAYYGTIYVIKASMNKIKDIAMEDIPYITEVVESIDINVY